ncbi:putative cyclic nucleotide-gated ion channel 20, chloroplastic isoform X2 [Nicotiana tabacum]|uniref:Cyclic nucleotide-gated ion channel 20, chloroplastic isoform X2 n=1 Tax=Nicotiana tabacum TaxID=4097 RepID=A0AC58UEL1_TOBAC
MGTSEIDEMPMLSPSYPQSNEIDGFQNQRFVYRTRSASLSMPMSSMDSFGDDSSFVGYNGPLRSEGRTSLVHMSGPLYISHKPENSSRPTPAAVVHKPTLPTTEKYPSIGSGEQNGWPNNDYTGKNEHLLKSGQLGMCSDPYCTTCPTDNHLKAQKKSSKFSDMFDHRFHNMLYGDTKGWAERTCSFLHPYIPGVMNPHAKIIQKWNKFFVISCLFAVFIDPLFFFVLNVQQGNNCIVLNWPMTKTIVILRSITDIIYLVHILLQFRLAYVVPESRVVGAGDLVDHPKKIAANYLSGYFVIDFFVVLPLPQRVNQCLQVACRSSNIERCMEFIDCGHGTDYTKFRSDITWGQWKNYTDACFTESSFDFGIYKQAVDLTTEPSVVTRYVYSFFWGFQVQIFALLDEPILDAICERLRLKTYIAGSKVLYRGGLVDKMVFIIRGKMESIGEDGNVAFLSEGDACGEEFLTWCLEHSSINRDGKKIRIPGHRLLSNRLVRCLTNVEAFILRAADLKEVTNLFARFSRSPRVQGVIRYKSPYRRRPVQVAWRCKKKRQSRADSSSPRH